MKPAERIVVGVDGSPGSYYALRRAVREAARVGAVVQAVTAWDWNVVDSVLLDSTSLAREHRRIAEALASEVADVAADGGAVVPVSAQIVQGSPARVLTQVSRGARLLVLGGHERLRSYGEAMGSVAEECVRIATCPTLIVPTAQPSPDEYVSTSARG
ncbi:MAG: universal stress protein [Stackebrandtia sp.]